MTEFCEFINNKVVFNLHPGQTKAMDSEKRFIFVLAGAQSGKTALAPIWMHREIRRKGAGDYLVVSPTYPLQNLKVVPEYVKYFQHTLRLGEYGKSDNVFRGKTDGFDFNIFFGSADRPDSLESATAKAAHLDEVGQKTFKLDSWLAVLRRLSINSGRVLGSTTVYNFGWMKNEIYDRWENGDPDIDVIQFDSTMNPAFPIAEYERQRKILPGWKFDMFYRGRYTKPAGMIYDSFDDKLCKIDPFPLPAEWPRYVGHDFGGVNMAALWVAEEKVNREVTNYYIYREYLEGGVSTAEHVKKFKELSYAENIVRRVGGSGSEDQFRRDFTTAGWPIYRPNISDVEAGIGRVYALHRQNNIYVFNTLKRYLDEKTTYSRKLNDRHEPTQDIEDKNSYHIMDTERYIFSYLTSRAKDTSNVTSDIHKTGVALP